MLRTVTFENDYGADELARAMLDAGYPSDATLHAIASGKVEDADDADREITLDCVVDEEDVLDDVSDEAIIRAADDLRLSHDGADAIEEAIRYVRSGAFTLAATMFDRVFEDDARRAAVGRALGL